MKHWHDWKLYCTYNGGGTNGTIRICAICESRKRFGADGDKLVNEYARKGEPFKSR